MTIDSCYKCVPPKRTPTCKFDGTCNKYAEAKEKHDREKAERDKQRAIAGEIYHQRDDRVYKAKKRSRRRI